MKTKVTMKGQITIPKALRDQLGLTTGVVMEFSAEKGRLIVNKDGEKNPFSEWRGRGRFPVGNGGLEYLKAVRDDHRAG